MTDDIRDLIGRYATGSLSAEEQNRLFEASLEDQDLFDELAHEDEVKLLLAAPRARDRMIRALEPPRRKTAWFAMAAVAGLGAAILIGVMMRPLPKPVEQAKVQIAENRPVSPPAPVEPPKSAPEPQPVASPAMDTLDRKDANGTAAAPAVAQQEVEKKAEVQAFQAADPGGPRQNQLTARSAGIHYSVETKGHVILIPSADGFLTVKGTDGAVLFATKRIAAGIIIDVVLPDDTSSIAFTFSKDSLPVQTPPVTRSDAQATIQGSNINVLVKIRP